MRSNPTDRTAVHEAGHGTIAEYLGLRVDRIVLETFQNGFTDLDEVIVPDDPDVAVAIHRSRVMIAVAGNAAVRAILGDYAAEQEKLEDLQHAQNDDEQARVCANAAATPGSSADDVLSSASLRVVEIFSQQDVRAAVADVAQRVRAAGRTGVTGADVRDALTAAGVRFPATA